MAGHEEARRVEQGVQHSLIVRVRNRTLHMKGKGEMMAVLQYLDRDETRRGKRKVGVVWMYLRLGRRMRRGRFRGSGC